MEPGTLVASTRTSLPKMAKPHTWFGILGLSLVCTNVTPVANMLDLSPPILLTVDHHSENVITVE